MNPILRLLSLVALISLAACQTNIQAPTAAQPSLAQTKEAKALPKPQVVSKPVQQAAQSPEPDEPTRYLYTLNSENVKISRHHLYALQESLDQNLLAKGLLAFDITTARIIEVDLVEYRIREPSMKNIFGVFAGKEKVYTMVRVMEAGQSKVLAAKLIRTHSSNRRHSIDAILLKHASKIAKFVETEG